MVLWSQHYFPCWLNFYLQNAHVIRCVYESRFQVNVIFCKPHHSYDCHYGYDFCYNIDFGYGSGGYPYVHCGFDCHAFLKDKFDCDYYDYDYDSYCVFDACLPYGHVCCGSEAEDSCLVPYGSDYGAHHLVLVTFQRPHLAAHY